MEMLEEIPIAGSRWKRASNLIATFGAQLSAWHLSKEMFIIC